MDLQYKDKHMFYKNVVVIFLPKGPVAPTAEFESTKFLQMPPDIFTKMSLLQCCMQWVTTLAAYLNLTLTRNYATTERSITIIILLLTLPPHTHTMSIGEPNLSACKLISQIKPHLVISSLPGGIKKILVISKWKIAS